VVGCAAGAWLRRSRLCEQLLPNGDFRQCQFLTDVSIDLGS
jgi:hypothetical protein